MLPALHIDGDGTVRDAAPIMTARRHVPASIVVALFLGAVLLMFAFVLALSGIVEPALRPLVAVLCAVAALALGAAVVRDLRRAREFGRVTLTSTPRLRVVPAIRSRLDGFISICDPETTGAMGWTAADVAKVCAQVESGRTTMKLVVDRPAGRVIGCVIPGPARDTFTFAGWIGTEHRRQGYGSELLDLLCADAFAAGCRSVLIAFPASNPALVPFFEQRQFVATGTHKLLSLHNTLIDMLVYRRMPPGTLVGTDDTGAS
jgi:L-amino acid N-acyltransferase YncA